MEWQANMRRAYQQGTLSSHRIRVLNNTPGWTWMDDPFEDNLRYWIETPNSTRATQWQREMRYSFRQGTLSSQRIQVLDNIPGWTWQEDDPFDNSLRHWVAMYRTYDIRPSLSSKNAEVKRAAQWQHDIRIAYRKGALSIDQIQALNNVPEWTWEDDHFEDNLRHWIDTQKNQF